MRDIDKKSFKNLRRKFSEYQEYYKILAIKKEKATDISVKEAFEFQKKQLEKVLQNFEGRYTEELRTIILTTLEDAYSALKDEDSRKHYEELLMSIKGEQR